MAGAGVINVIIERFVSPVAPHFAAGASDLRDRRFHHPANGVFLWVSTQSLRFPEPVAIGQVDVFGR